MPRTPCECPAAGWCARHRCWKPDAWHLLCQRNLAYFEAYERGEGPRLLSDEMPPPGEGPTESDNCPEPADQNPPGGPTLWQRAQNLGRAVVRHVADGATSVDDAVYEQRLAVCRECPSCDTARMVCQEITCGCVLAVKARWRSEHCPLNRWPVPHEEQPAVTPMP